MEYVIFGLVFGAVVLALAFIYVRLVVRMVREIHHTVWLSESEAARAVWTLVVVGWVLFGPLAWLVYSNWREQRDGSVSTTNVARY